MGLSADLLSEFSKVTKDSSDKKNKESTLFGTAVEYNGKMYVKLDGSELLTPVSTTAVIESGERVTVLLKNHNATVTGNLSSPSVRKGTVDALDGEVKELGTQITEFEIVIADKVSTQELEAEKARIDELVSENVVIRGTLTANEADISDLKADNVTINETLVANQADIESLQTTKLDAEIADITYATIDDLDATNADIHNLGADFGDFKVLTAENFSALDATIKELDAQKLSATEADIKYANIDFSNIGKAAMENLYANSGLIRDVIIDNGTITGHLVGVTISGDLIEGNTIIAEKLVIKGDDGLYYKLNTDGVTTEAEQTDYNSLNGSVIKAKSITATKVSVEDLVAFDATIGGFKITDSAIYSGVKETADNSTRGIYLDKTGQIAIGDSTNYLKYYKDQNGVYKLEISAGSIKLSSSNKTVETALSEMIVSSVEEFYQSSSSSSLSGGSWSASQPTWVDGTYIWRRTKVTYGDGHSDYSPSTTGVCITGNTGAEGPQGKSGVNGVGVSSVDVQYYKSTSSTSLVGGTWQTTNPGWENGKYIWSKTVVTYTDSSTDESSPVCLTGSTGSTGASGSDGSDGNDGVGISTIVEQYYQSSSSSNLSGGSWSNSYPGWVDGKYIWTRSVITYTNGKTTTTSAVCVTGSKGATGAQGEKGDTGEAGKGITSVVEYYAVSSSNSTAPSSWSTTVQTMTSTDKYLWNYEVITYTDSSTSETKKRVIGAYGNTGDTGATGATGRGISSITEYYLVSDSSSGVTTSTSGWSTDISTTTTTNKYLWNYEKITYTDNTNVNTTPKIIGTHGATGDAGNGISKTEVYYYLSTSSTAQSGGSWSTTVPEWVDGRYYWQKIKTTYTNGSTSESTPVCITGAKGATGATGSTGTGVESITTEFYLSSSKTTQTGGSWSTTMPIWSSGMYLWTRNKVVYKNPSSTVYTTPICDSSWEAVNEIQIGGRNLIRGTKNFKIDDTQTVGWKNTDSWSLETDDEGFTVASKSQTDQTSNNIPSIYSSRFPVSLGDVLIYSCWFKVDDVDVWDGLKSPYIFEGYDSSNTRVQYQDVSVFVTNSNRPTVTSGEWVYFYSTHTITDESVVKAGMRLTLFRNGSIHIKKCKVEKGNKPTDWTPAPEDVEQDINDTANDIYQEISDQSTNIISDCEAIILEATKNYIKTSDFAL